MKIKTICSVAILLILSCSDESSTEDVKKFNGIWVPYEIKYENGSISEGPFTNSTIFGIYAESVQLKEDKTYVPVIWTDKDNYHLKTVDGGNFEYIPNETKLLFKSGSMDLEFEVIKYNDDDLWLKYVGELTILGGSQAQYKLKRQPE